MTPNTVLVGVDFSPESECALKQGLEIARHTGSKLVLLHAGAIPDEPIGVPESMASTVNAFRQEMRQRLHTDREKLEELRERYTGQGAEISTMVIEGFADTSICEAAEQLGAGLVCVGTHGQTGIKRFLLGSIAERVVRLCATRVLVARPGRDVYSKVLVPIDFSDGTEDVVQSALMVAGPDAQIDLLYCWHLPVIASAYYAPAHLHEEVVGPMRDSMLDVAEEKANALIEKFADKGATISFSTTRGAPSYGIGETIEKGEYDCVVMGSHGRRGVRRWILGSVAEVTVRHSGCSVLVVHP